MKQLIATLAAVAVLSVPALAIADPCPPENGPVSTVGNSVREASRWSATVRDSNGRIDYRASSSAAFSAVGSEWHALTHLDKMKASEDLITGVPILGPILFIATYPPMIVSDALDIVVSPVMIAKHILVGTLQGAAGLFQSK